MALPEPARPSGTMGRAIGRADGMDAATKRVAYWMALLATLLGGLYLLGLAGRLIAASFRGK